jgi:hypothetical protein
MGTKVLGFQRQQQQIRDLPPHFAIFGFLCKEVGKYKEPQRKNEQKKNRKKRK